MSDTASSATSRVGRPRDDSLDAVVVSAALELVEEMGIASVSVDAIAARAGVGKATIYRRWRSKEDLLIDGIAGLLAQAQPPDSTDVREVLISLLERMRSFLTSTTAGNIFPWLVGELSCGTELGRRYYETVIVPRRRLIAQVVSEAVTRGELRADLDIEMAVDMLTGPPILRKLLRAIDVPDEGWEARFVDSLLRGWARD